MIVKIFTGPLNYTISTVYQADKEEYLIGADEGALHAIEAGLHLDLAVGDFDSVSKLQLEQIEKHATSVKIFPSRKDFTDTYLAVKEAIILNPDKIMVYGGIGNRFDHSFANVNLLKLGNIEMITDNQKLFILDPGNYNIENNYDFISFFALEDVTELNLKGFSYEVNQLSLQVDDPLCISNQDSGNITFQEGLLLVIMANDN